MYFQTRRLAHATGSLGQIDPGSEVWWPPVPHIAEVVFSIRTKVLGPSHGMQYPKKLGNLERAEEINSAILHQALGQAAHLSTLERTPTRPGPPACTAGPKHPLGHPLLSVACSTTYSEAHYKL